MENIKKLYIVVSQTGSIVSRILKILTGAKYNHVSVALDESISPMYSFARKYTYNPFWGAFVKEYPGKGALARFKNTEITVLELPCSQEQYEAVKARLEKMYREREKYRYNYRGLFSAYFSKKYHKKHHYYCSEFVRDLLERSGIIPEGTFGEIAKPIDFLTLPGTESIYCGKLRKYRPRPKAASSPREEARPLQKRGVRFAAAERAAEIAVAMVPQDASPSEAECALPTGRKEGQKTPAEGDAGVLV